MVVFAEHDTVQSKAGCQPMIERARRAGARTDTIVFPGVTHAFDERLTTPDSTFRFDPRAAARAHAEFITWLQTPAG